MRLVMLAPFGIRPKGTLAARMLPLAEQLAGRGWQVTIVAPADLNPADAGSTSLHSGVVVEHLPLGPAGPVGMATTTLRMLRRALQLSPELVHLFKPKGYGALAALALRRLRPALPLIVDSDDWEGRGGWNELLAYPRPIKALIDWQERTLPRVADRVTVASKSLETQVWGFGVKPERVVYLPNGLRPAGSPRPARQQARAQLELDQRPTGLLYTRFWEFPVEDVVAALAGIRARCPDFRLLVLGTGERGEERRLDQLAERAGLAGLLDQRGWADEQTILAALAAADLAIYPMRDSLITRAKAPVKLLELMAAGLPIVAAGVGEVGEYLEHGECGLLVRPDSGGALARGALTLLGDPARARDLGERARARISQVFRWDRLATIVEQAYLATLE